MNDSNWMEIVRYFFFYIAIAIIIANCQQSILWNQSMFYPVEQKKNLVIKYLFQFFFFVFNSLVVWFSYSKLIADERLPKNNCDDKFSWCKWKWKYEMKSNDRRSHNGNPEHWEIHNLNDDKYICMSTTRVFIFLSKQ